MSAKRSFLRRIVLTYHTKGRHRRYDVSALKELFGLAAERLKRKVIAYARVSSHDQKEDLERQIERLDRYCDGSNEINSYEVISDLGSGMNYKKRGLKKLLRLILSGCVSKVVLTHKDRLLRFGSELIFGLCEFFGTSIVMIEEEESLSDEVLLARDVLEIITVFSARLYGKRAHQKKSLKLA